MTSEVEDDRHIGEIGRSCTSCGGRGFRRSRLKLKDVWGLIALHYPVRCLACNKRQMVVLPAATRAVSSRAKLVKGLQSSTSMHDAGAQVTSHQEARMMPDLHGITLKSPTSLPIKENQPRL